MTLFCNQLYRSLQKELALYPKAGALTLPEVEGYFHCCFRYWMVLYKKMSVYTFRSREEEIHFFKKIKPLFTSELHYAQLVCSALLFRPEGEGAYIFWKKEREKLQRFLEEHRSFYRYYQEGHTHCDLLHFTRIKTHIPRDAKRLYADEGLTSRYDPLVSRLLALDRYNLYVQAQLSLLNKASEL